MREDRPPRTRPGRPYPLGATWDAGGVNFALFAEHATAVALCFYDERDPGKETRQIDGRWYWTGALFNAGALRR